MRRRASSTAQAGGFTLIELLLVVVIIGMLAAIVVPRIAGRSKEAAVTSTKASINSLSNALNMFEVDNHFYPSTDQGLDALLVKPDTEQELKNWRKYLTGEELPKDAWGTEFVYRLPEEGDEFELFSTGPDGQEGTEDDVRLP